MPRAPRRCGYCKEVEHTRATCRDLEVDKILQMCGGQFEGSPETVKRHKIPFEKIAEVQLLIEGRHPAAIFKTYQQLNVPARKYEIVIVRLTEDRTFEKEPMMYSEEQWTTINSTWIDYTNTIKDNARLIAEKSEKYLQKLGWLDRDLPGILSYDGQFRHQDEFSTRSLHNLFHVDYVIEKERLLHEQTERNDDTRRFNTQQSQYQALYNRYRALQNQYQANNANIKLSGRWVNRKPLPIISTKAFEAEDCPICMEPLGETSKVILRCGHQMCVTCMLTQTILAAKERNSKKCQCPHCREEYL